MPATTPGTIQDIVTGDPFVGSWFTIEFDNDIDGIFKSASGLSIDIEVVEANDTYRDTISRKRPGTTKYSEVTLKRTLSPDKAFWNWIKKIRDGNLDYRTNGAIVVHNMAGEEIGRWTLTNVWPSKWSASDLDVGTDDLMEEEVTLQVEQLQRVK